LKVLIADDELATQRVLETLLEKHGYEVVLARNGREALDLLEREDAPDLVILDWLMPDVDGIEICRRVREWKKERYSYIIMLTAKTATEDFVLGLDAGMDDYLSKPFHPDELRARVRVGERMLALHEQLRIQATRDHLTGILNRGTVIEIAQRELAQAARKGEYAALVFGDIDSFKQVNDTHGHLAGDAILCETSKRLAARLRAYDVLGRYGGEEFLILLPSCDGATAGKVAEDLRDAVASAPVSTEAGELSITMSFGFVAVQPTASTKWEDLVRAADEALYRAKRAGRNRVAGPAPEDDQQPGKRRK
jgi:two-component system, cell cycle response regulator